MLSQKRILQGCSLEVKSSDLEGNILGSELLCCEISEIFLYPIFFLLDFVSSGSISSFSQQAVIFLNKSLITLVGNVKKTNQTNLSNVVACWKSLCPNKKLRAVTAKASVWRHKHFLSGSTVSLSKTL